MITVLLIAILSLEVIRLCLYIRDSDAVKKINIEAQQRAIQNAEFVERQNKEWKQLRQTELAELKELAKTSDIMKQIYDEWKEQQITIEEVE